MKKEKDKEIAEWLRKQHDVEAGNEPMITYAHKDAPSHRFRQSAKIPVPSWAVDIKPDTTTEEES